MTTIQENKINAYFLEAGIIFHSVFIGLSLGSSSDESLVKALAFALFFHQVRSLLEPSLSPLVHSYPTPDFIIYFQGFEGVALGGVVAKAEIKGLKLLIFGVLFALTTPLGIVIGLAVKDSYNSNDKTYLAFDGIINSIASGVLLYNGIVDLLLPSFKYACGFGRTSVGKLSGFASLFLGAAIMSLIAIWA